MVETQPTFQSVLNMVNMLPYKEQKQLIATVQYNLALCGQNFSEDQLREVFEKAYKHLGELYGLNDIREAK